LVRPFLMKEQSHSECFMIEARLIDMKKLTSKLDRFGFKLFYFGSV